MLSSKITDQVDGSLPRYTWPASFYGYSVFRKYYESSASMKTETSIMTLKSLFLTVLVLLFVQHGFTVVEAQADGEAERFGGNPSGCVENVDNGADLFPTKSTVTDATLFTIEYMDTYKVLKNLATGETLILYQCGTTAPTDVPENAKIFPIPVENVTVSETIGLTFIELIGERLSIAAGGMGFVSSPCVLSLVKSGDITDLGFFDDKGVTETTSLHLAYSSNPDEYSNSIALSATNEVTALGRSEWIKFIAAFYNLEKLANEHFDAVVGRYDAIVAEVAKALDDGTITKKTGAFTTYVDPAFNGGKPPYEIDDGQYKQDLLNAAGVNALPPNAFETTEEWKQAVNSADAIIDETYLGGPGATFEEWARAWEFDESNLDDERNPVFVRNRQVYQLDGTVGPTGGFAWFEFAIPEADVVLEDLVKVFYPGLRNHVNQFMRNIETTAVMVVTDEDCEDPSAPLDPLAGRPELEDPDFEAPDTDEDVSDGDDNGSAADMTANFVSVVSMALVAALA
eukprot:Clim_evm30s3 gene=Clim_evmTU30s3